MKLITFRRESNDFTDILNDHVLKKYLKHKVSWFNCLQLNIRDDKIISYIELKYGESIWSNIVPDRSPIPNVDYLPKNALGKY